MRPFFFFSGSNLLKNYYAIIVLILFPPWLKRFRRKKAKRGFQAKLSASEILCWRISLARRENHFPSFHIIFVSSKISFKTWFQFLCDTQTHHKSSFESSFSPSKSSFFKCDDVSQSKQIVSHYSKSICLRHLFIPLDETTTKTTTTATMRGLIRMFCGRNNSPFKLTLIGDKSARGLDRNLLHPPL